MNHMKSNWNSYNVVSHNIILSWLSNLGNKYKDRKLLEAIMPTNITLDVISYNVLIDDKEVMLFDQRGSWMWWLEMELQ